MPLRHTALYVQARGRRPPAWGPEGIPAVTDEKLARQFPELAVLSAMAHGDADVATAVALAEIAAAAALGSESDKRALNLDLIETTWRRPTSAPLPFRSPAKYSRLMASAAGSGGSAGLPGASGGMLGDAKAGFGGVR
jgi:hypothetical protein